MTIFEIAGLVAAAFIGGAINAVAGGGSLVSFPALLAVGYSSKSANVTNTVALVPGYAAGSWGYRDELGRQRSRVAKLAPAAIVGALAGSIILLSTPQSAFDLIIPFLILFACTLMALQDRLGAWAREHHIAARDADHVPLVLHCAVFALAIYGAYFGAGVGIITLAVLGILLPDDIQHSNALKGILSLLINGIAVAYFAPFGPVHWGAVALMAPAAVAGGSFGVGVARRLGRVWLRRAVISYGLVVAAILFYKL